MDERSARFQCLRLAAMTETVSHKGAGTILEIAKEWAVFVNGAPLKSHSGFGKEGRDDPKK